jgi:hypothetical protein
MVKQPGLFLPKFRAMTSHVFMQSPQNVAVAHGIQSLACWNNSLCTVPLMPKKVMIMLLTLLFTCLAFFGLGDMGLFHTGSIVALSQGHNHQPTSHHQ